MESLIVAILEAVFQIAPEVVKAYLDLKNGADPNASPVHAKVAGILDPALQNLKDAEASISGS